MPILLEKTIIHILDTTNGVPILSDCQLTANEEIADFISSITEKAFYSDDAKECIFKDESNVWEQCSTANWDVTSISQSFAEHIFNIMRRNAEIPSADVVFGIAKIDGITYLFMLKLDYKTAFTHFVDVKSGNKDINIIQHKAILPTQVSKIYEGFFINTEKPSVKMLERKYTIDGIKDFYLSTQVLVCNENKTPKQKATKVLRVAEKVAEMYYTQEDDMETHITSTMLDELQQEQPLVVEKLGRKFFENNPAAQQEFFERLAISNIPKDETLSLSERFQKKFEKQAIRTASGVEIKIPTQIYSNADEIEFINNPDGTISLLIKNIKL